MPDMDGIPVAPNLCPMILLERSAVRAWTASLGRGRLLPVPRRPRWPLQPTRPLGSVELA